MQEGKPDLAENECQTILDTASGTDANSPFYKLAHVGLAHAYAALGKKSESREEYEKFLPLERSGCRRAGSQAGEAGT